MTAESEKHKIAIGGNELLLANDNLQRLGNSLPPPHLPYPVYLV